MNMTEPANFILPKKPRVREKEAPPDARNVSVVPLRAAKDRRLGDATLRALVLICSYCNRAGITWVSQKRVSEDGQISQQAISKHIKKLQEFGYLEVLKKGFRGERANTIRIIFDPKVDAETAISITSAQEDTRPPYMKDEQPDPIGQRRVAQMVAQALKPINQPKEYQMPQGNETLTVKKMKAEMTTKRKPKAQSKGVTSTTSEVVHEDTSHSQPKEPPFTTSYTTSEVVRTQKNIGIREVFKEYLKEDLFVQLNEFGLSDEVIADNLSILIDTYRSEGLTPKPDQLVQDIIQLSKV